jgi:hypothetical protein
MMMCGDLQAGVKALHIPWTWSDVLTANQGNSFQRMYLPLLHGGISESQVIHPIHVNGSAVTKHNTQHSLAACEATFRE